MSASIKGLERVAADRRHLIAQQVRCSTGYTWGRAEAGVAKIVLAPRAATVLGGAVRGQGSPWLRVETVYAR